MTHFENNFFHTAFSCFGSRRNGNASTESDTERQPDQPLDSDTPTNVDTEWQPNHPLDYLTQYRPLIDQHTGYTLDKWREKEHAMLSFSKQNPSIRDNVEGMRLRELLNSFSNYRCESAAAELVTYDREILDQDFGGINEVIQGYLCSSEYERNVVKPRLLRLLSTAEGMAGGKLAADRYPKSSERLAWEASHLG